MQSAYLSSIVFVISDIVGWWTGIRTRPSWTDSRCSCSVSSAIEWNRTAQSASQHYMKIKVNSWEWAGNVSNWHLLFCTTYLLMLVPLGIAGSKSGGLTDQRDKVMITVPGSLFTIQQERSNISWIVTNNDAGVFDRVEIRVIARVPITAQTDLTYRSLKT